MLISLRAVLFVRGAVLSSAAQLHTACDRSTDDLPRYSILVPLYKEARSIPNLLKALMALDYPADKVEVFFLVEQDDVETRTALARLHAPPTYKTLVLPDGQPRTKPRALNAAMAYISGQIVTIYDAEDHPHPSQLRQAAEALDRAGSVCACVQAPLRAYNGRASWIAGQWGLEYEMHFGLLLPALAEAGLPIALGGTSNHFRLSALREVAGWDAWNVTEDADLGLRLSRFGYRVGTILPRTLEEAPEVLSVWLPQRSRWVKGYMQTLAVLLRHPVRVAREMGMRQFSAGAILLVGAVMSALLHGPLALICLICCLLPGTSLPIYCVVLMISGGLVNLFAALAAPKQGCAQRILLVLTAPFYWPLQSLAAAHALYELVVDPYSWSKTPHALTRHMVTGEAYSLK